ncbi:ATP-binding protein [Halopenitus sp. H-Gu1]|uniref:ATP-binding protein n=1 Tax=Halopenitus sp. H-Gu1 TaxID=3242697 RepID=UPI00359DCF04
MSKETRSSRIYRRVPSWTVSGIGGVLLALVGLHHVQTHLSAFVSTPTQLEFGLQVLESVLMWIPAAGLTYSGYWIRARNLSKNGEWLVLEWTLIGLSTVVGLITAINLHQIVVGLDVPRSLVEMEILTGAGIGGSLGVLIGYHRARSLKQTHQLEGQRDGFLFLNRLLRHHVLNRIQLIDGYATQLDDHVDADGERLLDSIQARSETIAQLIQDVSTVSITFSESPSGTRVNLSETIEREIEEVQQLFPAAEFETRIPRNVTVQANDLLFTVFENLLDNAIRHNDADTPNVTVTVKERSHTVQTRITDNGPGIPEPKERFLDPGEVGDRGMGLYLVSQLIKRYNGDITLEENEPHGTVVVITLPKAES